MNIKRMVINNFKKFDCISINFNEGLNIFVGNNEEGKSTLIEAIHLALTGYYRGQKIASNLSEYIFNANAVNEYLKSVKNAKPIALPLIYIEIWFSGDKKELARFNGSANSECDADGAGIVFEVRFDENYQNEYELLLADKNNKISSLPIEYYQIRWRSFANENITPRMLPFTSVFIDASAIHNNVVVDNFLSRVVRGVLDTSDVASVTQNYRTAIDNLADSNVVRQINTKLQACNSFDKTRKILLNANRTTNFSWLTALTVHLDNTPFVNMGRGMQCVVATHLALTKQKERTNVVLFEEPENHLSYSHLNELIEQIQRSCCDKQIIITTHSSFVANKLGLNKLILLNNGNIINFSTIKSYDFFKKSPGYDTLRFLLCKKAIFVEGDSDELIVQRAYMDLHDGKLPIYDGIDVISVKTTFLRFLELAEKLNKKVAVVSDNDGNYEAVKRKYEKYMGINAKTNIKICIDSEVDTIDDTVKEDDFNMNTLEPKLLKENNLVTFNEIFGRKFKTTGELLHYMHDNKTDCALAIFDYKGKINYPQYILDAIQDE